jgi:predicted HAD superfamily phosphohydrolase YqeG
LSINGVGDKTLVLDLDETMIHCEEEGQGEVQIPIKLPDGSIIEVVVKLIVG